MRLFFNIIIHINKEHSEYQEDVIKQCEEQFVPNKNRDIYIHIVNLPPESRKILL